MNWLFTTVLSQHNKGIALDIDNSAQLGAPMWNLLFADGDNDAIRAKQLTSMHLVNVTFVKNKGNAIDGTASVYNSIAWKNGQIPLRIIQTIMSSLLMK